MQIKRRDLLAGIGVLAATGALPQAQTPSGRTFPRKSDFAIPAGLTYINGAFTHPMPIAGVEAVRQHAERRSRPGGIAAPGNAAMVKAVKAEFAALINAKPSEISYVPNTSTGENLVVNGLGIVGTDSNVVTDALHFDGALLHLGELKRRSGLDVRTVMPRDWRIDLKDLERVIDRKTKLVEISLVAMANGFQHDPKAVCDLAHSRGAYVYADIVQAAGNTPIDVRASGVDFAACSTFKWLMGDFGLGFLYVKEEVLDRVLRQTQYGYYKAAA